MEAIILKESNIITVHTLFGGMVFNDTYSIAK